MTATVMQPDLDLTLYPKDHQNLAISFESYGLTHGVMGLYFEEDPIGIDCAIVVHRVSSCTHVLIM